MFIQKMDEFEGASYLSVKSDGGKVVLGDDFTIDCKNLEDDTQKVVDVMADKDGNLSLDGDYRFAATVIIPPRTYHEEQDTEITTDPMTGDKYYGLKQVENPFNVDSVTVYLFPLEKVSANE